MIANTRLSVSVPKSKGERAADRAAKLAAEVYPADPGLIFNSGRRMGAITVARRQVAAALRRERVSVTQIAAVLRVDRRTAQRLIARAGA